MKLNHQKFLSILIIICTLLIACAPSQPASSYSGTIETEAQGNNGPIKVKTTFTDSIITNVEVVSNSETPSLAAKALTDIPTAIVKNNSINVDVVSGATFTSKAIVDAVKAAIAEAKLNEADFANTAKVEKGEDKTLTTDVLIIGAGGSGLAAANAAIRENKKVIVIDKMPQVGGATALSGGLFIGPGSKLQEELLEVKNDSAEIAYNDLLIGGEDNDKSLLKLFTDNSGPTIDWLYYDLKLPVVKGTQFVEHTNPRVFGMEGGAAAITDLLLQKFKEAGGEVLLETKANELIVKDGVVAGAIAEGPDKGIITINAKNTILATGGYGNNAELLNDSVADAIYYGSPSSTGDGLKMAEKVNAATQYMDHLKVYPGGLQTSPGKGHVISAGEVFACTTTGAILVNKEGQRVVNENSSFVDIKLKTIEQPNKMLYLLLDKAGYDQWVKGILQFKQMSQESIDKYIKQNGGTPLLANGASIEEVAKIAEIDPAALKSTVDKFNGYVKAGKDADFGRKELFPFGEGPYYLIEQRLRFATSLGGLKVDNNMQVLTEDGNPISGLYAAGEVVGGVHGKEAMPGCMVTWALTSGRLAGLAVSK